jgi:prophage regulatory protein
MASIILRLPAVKACTGLSRSTIYLRMAQRTFPQAILLGGAGARAIGWRETEIDDWLASRIASSRALPAEQLRKGGVR